MKVFSILQAKSRLKDGIFDIIAFRVNNVMESARNSLFILESQISVSEETNLIAMIQIKLRNKEGR